MSIALQQIDLIGKAERITTAIKEALEMPDCKYIGVCPTIARMNEELRTLHMQLRETIERPKATKKIGNPFGMASDAEPRLRGGVE